MFRALSLGLVLLAVWMLLSGHYEPLLIGLGVASCALVVFLTRRMRVVDQEGFPIHLSAAAALTYWPWLAWQIVLANIDVTRRVLSPRPVISPTLVRVRTSQKSDVALVTYANSITLTPGTISIDVVPGEILVHALSKEGAANLEAGEMDRRVTRMAGEV